MILQVRVKPASSEFEIDLAVNFDSDNYDRDADPRVQIMKQVRIPPLVMCIYIV